MAEQVDNLVLPPNRYLVLMDEDSCVGTIVRKPVSDYGPFQSRFTNTRIFGPESIPEPPEPVPPSTIVEYTRVVVKVDGAQEINVDGVDYIIVHTNDILAFIEPEE